MLSVGAMHHFSADIKRGKLARRIKAMIISPKIVISTRTLRVDTF